MFGPPKHLLPKQNGTANKYSKPAATKTKQTTTKTALEPVKEADITVTTIRMLPIPIPDGNRFNKGPPIENDKSSESLTKLFCLSLSPYLEEALSHVWSNA